MGRVSFKVIRLPLSAIPERSRQGEVNNNPLDLIKGS